MKMLLGKEPTNDDEQNRPPARQQDDRPVARIRQHQGGPIRGQPARGSRPRGSPVRSVWPRYGQRVDPRPGLQQVLSGQSQEGGRAIMGGKWLIINRVSDPKQA